MDKIKLTKENHKMLKPFDKLYRKMHEEGMKILENASNEELQDIINAMSKTGTTNCAWTEYHVSRNFLPIAEDILSIRLKKASEV
jgi:predicted house-cleaning noncanonical NTP pyrophosphatase (MazG superfamily)